MERGGGGDRGGCILCEKGLNRLEALWIYFVWSIYSMSPKIE